MILKIDLDDSRPIYEQIAEQIVMAISRGEIKEGESLPSVRRLASDLSINLHTVNKAYQMLQVEGFLSVRRSRGAVVSSQQNYAADAAYKRYLRDELFRLILKARLRGVEAGQVKDAVDEIYLSLQGEE